MKAKVGIPRALFYYRYFPMWSTFFEELGAEIVVSEPTNRYILDTGVKNCVDEACLPVKLFHGHVISLRDKVDYLFIPRLTSISKNEYVCPKLGGLPDLVRHSIKGLPEIISTEINLRKSQNNLLKAAYEAGRYFTGSRRLVREALDKAIEAQKSYEEGRTGIDSEPGLRVAVIGHPYLLDDNYINMSLLQKLKKRNVKIITPDMVDEASINIYACCYSKPVFWNYARIATGSTFYAVNNCNIDGIIFVMSFGCGIDSFICDLIERRIRRSSDIPVIFITIDEQTGEAGLNTRLEAFLDMILWRKLDENNISASW